MKADEDEVSFEVGQREDGTLWTVSVACDSGLSEQEFAAALKSLADDIVEGNVSFAESPEVKPVGRH